VVVRDSDAYDDAILAMRAKSLTYAPVTDADNVVVRTVDSREQCTPSDLVSHTKVVHQCCERHTEAPIFERNTEVLSDPPGVWAVPMRETHTIWLSEEVKP
jgi:hypothetical protein